MPVPPPPPPPPTFALANTEKPSLNKSEQRERNALLSDIAKGKRLKKTLTNDRSVPVLEKPRGGVITRGDKGDTFTTATQPVQQRLQHSNVPKQKDNGRDTLSVHKVSRPALGGLQTKLPLPLPSGIRPTRSLSAPQSPSVPPRPPGLPCSSTQGSLHPPPPPNNHPSLPRLPTVPAECCPLSSPKERKPSLLPQWPPQQPPPPPSKPAHSSVCQAITHRANLPPLPPMPRVQKDSPRPPKKSQSFAGYDRSAVRSRPLPPLPDDRPPPNVSLEATSGPPLPPNKPTLRGLHPLPLLENSVVNFHNQSTESWEHRFTFHPLIDLPPPEAYVPGPKTYPSDFVKRYAKGKRERGSPPLPPVIR